MLAQQQDNIKGIDPTVDKFAERKQDVVWHEY